MNKTERDEARELLQLEAKLVRLRIERISFGHHHIHLPQRGHTHADDAHRYKQDTDYSLFIIKCCL